MLNKVMDHTRTASTLRLDEEIGSNTRYDRISVSRINRRDGKTWVIGTYVYDGDAADEVWNDTDRVVIYADLAGA